MIQPLSVGNVLLKNNLIQAPLAGYTDLPFRLIVREQGAGLTVSEMIAAEGVIRNGEKSLALAETCPEERPFAVQIFGARTSAMAEAARILSGKPIDLIDINMGCPVPKVVRSGSGAALLKDPREAGGLMRAVVAASRVPVTIKIRAGWDAETKTALDVAREAEQAGVAAVTIHARTRSQGFSGQADWRIIAAVKKAVGIPVIGNGDVFSAEDARRMFEETDCDGIMIGRGAIGNPWIYREIISLLGGDDGLLETPSPPRREGHPLLIPSPLRGEGEGEGEAVEAETGLHPHPSPLPQGRGGVVEVPSLDERRDVMLRHLKMLAEIRGEVHAARLFRKYVSGYTRGLTGSAGFRSQVNQAGSSREIMDLIQRYFDRTLQSAIAE